MILKNIFRFSNQEGGLQVFFSRMFLSIPISFFVLFSRFIKTGIQTDTPCVKLSLIEHLSVFSN